MRITAGIAQRKTWWRNFQSPHAIRLRLAGVDHLVTAEVVHDGDRVCVVADLTPPS